MGFDRNKPYNSLPLLPPKADIENKEILKRCISARCALSALKQAGELIPNQTILINTIPLLEAQLSSEIENIVTTTDKLFQYASLEEDHADPATKETLRYRQALYQGYLAIRQKPVCVSTAIEVCSRIRNTDIGIRKMPGTALANHITKEIIYTPPTGEDVLKEKLFNWEKYINENTDIDPLIRMAVMHYQFEAIHPFTDGNGRTGRVLNILFMIQENLLEIPVLYMSRFFIKNKSQYYVLLKEVTEHNNWQGWILYVLDAVENTANWTTGKIKAMRDMLSYTCNYVKKELPKIYSRELVDMIFAQPYCRISNLVETGIAKRQSASKYLKEFASIGILTEIKVGKEKLFIHPNLLNLLTQDENSFKPYKKNKELGL